MTEQTVAIIAFALGIIGGGTLTAWVLLVGALLRGAATNRPSSTLPPTGPVPVPGPEATGGGRR